MCVDKKLVFWYDESMLFKEGHWVIPCLALINVCNDLRPFCVFYNQNIDAFPLISPRLLPFTAVVFSCAVNAAAWYKWQLCNVY